MERGSKKVRERGYRVIWGDVTKIRLGRKFEVIVAGEILEHLPNQGLFGECEEAPEKEGSADIDHL